MIVAIKNILKLNLLIFIVCLNAGCGVALRLQATNRACCCAGIYAGQPGTNVYLKTKDKYMQKDDRITEVGTAVDSDMQPIVTTSTSIEANPMLPAVESGTLRPILFSAPMVQAILEGRKTQTRRVVKMKDGSLMEAEDLSKHLNGSFDKVMDFTKTYPFWQELKCPYGNVGDILWVRETYGFDIETGKGVYKANEGRFDNGRNINEGLFVEKWKPSIFMPFAACRIFLKVKNIRVEQLQEISERDAVNEGIKGRVLAVKPYDYVYQISNSPNYYYRAAEAFKNLWANINGKDSWENNPFVWVIEFERCVHSYASS